MSVSFLEKGPQSLIQELSSFCERDPLLKHIFYIPILVHMWNFSSSLVLFLLNHKGVPTLLSLIFGASRLLS